MCELFPEPWQNVGLFCMCGTVTRMAKAKMLGLYNSLRRADVLLVTGKPGRPGELVAVTKTATSLELLVSPPEEDGGSPVLRYVVEVQKVPSHRWVRHSVAVPDPTQTYVGRLRHYHTIYVAGLESHQRYRVRVSAVNQAGCVGPPSMKYCHKPEVVNEGIKC